MEKLRRVLSGQDDEEQGLTAQVTSSAAATVGGGTANRSRGVGPGSPGLSGPGFSAMAFLCALPSCTKFRRPCSEQASGPGCLWPAHSFQVSR